MARDALGAREPLSPEVALIFSLLMKQMDRRNAARGRKAA